jgi:hypothetical protein
MDLQFEELLAQGVQVSWADTKAPLGVGRLTDIANITGALLSVEDVKLHQLPDASNSLSNATPLGLPNDVPLAFLALSDKRRPNDTGAISVDLADLDRWLTTGGEDLHGCANHFDGLTDAMIGCDVLAQIVFNHPKARHETKVDRTGGQGGFLGGTVVKRSAVVLTYGEFLRQVNTWANSELEALK